VRRLVSLLCIVVCVILLIGSANLVAQECHGPGVARWPIKTSLPDGTNLSRAGKLVPLAQLLSLADPPGEVENGIQSLRDFGNRFRFRTRTKLSTNLFRSADGGRRSAG
jgi:hypothetical protein